MYRIDILLKQQNRLFHTRDLALLWQIPSDNTLYTLIKRYAAKGILVPVQKGLYATVPLTEVHPFILGAAIIHRYGYVSCEYVLAHAGVIFQAQQSITFISSVSRKFTAAGHHFSVRQLADRFLYNDTGLHTDSGVLVASPERAAADVLYFDPQYHFDNRRALNWHNVQTIQKIVGYM
jgi:predicted transcriptional regulator of viral defense system